MDIIKFHVENNYYVSVEPFEKFYGCVATFPANKINCLAGLTKTYMFCEKSYTIDYYAKFNKSIVKKELIQATSSNIKLLVIQDIFLTTLRLNISKKLIISNNKNIFKLLTLPQTEKDRKKERKLCTEFMKILSGKMPDSNVEGYDQLLYYFEKGGFLP